MAHHYEDVPVLLEFMAIQRLRHEAERMQFAQRLHNEAAQALSAFRMKCYLLDARLRGIASGLADDLVEIMPILDEAIGVIRDVSEELRPGILRLGIEAAIEWQAEQFQSRTDIACVVDIDTGPQLLHPNRVTELFRIFQQAIANVQFHAGATVIDVKLRHEDDEILLEIGDDGVQPLRGESMEHAFGVFTIEERVKRAGGTFSMSGSALRIRLPLERNQPEMELDRS